MPRVKITKTTKVALFFLQLYLFALIAMLLVRFIIRR
jgi:hypothetical protein